MISKKFAKLKEQVDIVNRCHKHLLNDRELSLSGSQSTGYHLYVVGLPSRVVLGHVAHGNYKQIDRAINIFARTTQIIGVSKFGILNTNTNETIY
jgi:hypothetical protein